MKTLILILMMSLPILAQTVEKRAGETIYLIACGAEGDMVNFYRKTGPALAATKIGSLVRIPGVLACKEIQYVMPAGTTTVYRFFAIPVKGIEFLDDTNGARVKRKP